MNERWTWLYLALLSAGGGLGAGGCKEAQEPTEPPPICASRLPEHLAHKNPDQLPASQWFKLVFKGYTEGSAPQPVDCLGEPIQWTPLPDDCDVSEPVTGGAPSARALAEKSLIVRHAGGDYWYGWAIFREYPNGMAEGPIAIARNHHGRLEARALGTLRAYASRPRLEVRRIGDSHVLTAEGERCEEGGPCQRAVRMMWLDRQRFRQRPLRSATVRQCLGPAWFPMTEVATRRVNQRWERKLQRDLALAFEPGGITIDEHILVNDRDLDQPSLPPRLFREAQARISIQVTGGELLAEGHSLWKSIQIEDGSTASDSE